MELALSSLSNVIIDRPQYKVSDTFRVRRSHVAIAPTTAPPQQSTTWPQVAIKANISCGGDGIARVCPKDLPNVLGILLFNQYYHSQEFCADTLYSGASLRVTVIGGDPVSAERFQAASGWKSNLHQGGTSTAVQMTETIRSAALAVLEALGRSANVTAGIDFLETASRGLVFLECNPSPSMLRPPATSDPPPANYAAALCDFLLI